MAVANHLCSTAAYRSEGRPSKRDGDRVNFAIVFTEHFDFLAKGFAAELAPIVHTDTLTRN
jgi:hypothetical protein